MAEVTTATETRGKGWRREIVALSSLAWPIAATNLAQVAMSATDVVMMGRLGPETMAAGALGANLYFIPLLAGIGLLNAVAPIAARILGRDPDARDDVARTVRQGLWSCLLLALPCWVALWWSEHLLLAMGQDAALAAQAGIYVRTLMWALLPFWAYLVLRSFMSVLERPFWALIVGLVGVAANAVGNWCLMLGGCGFEPIGIAGSGIATTLASTLMLAAVAIVVLYDRRFSRFEVLARLWRPDWSRLAGLWRLGLPMAATLLFEVTIFNAAVFLMGLIGTAALAAHTIAIQIASLTFMVPLGIGQAATVRVGLAYGRRDLDGIHRAGWAAFWLATGFMTLTSLLMIFAPHTLIAAFLDTSSQANAEVVSLAATYLLLAALFQIADGAQAAGGGMLRGLHDARAPMVFALVGYWVIGLPLGVVLGFGAGLGGTGIWIGLATGLAVVAVLMMHRWQRREALGLVDPMR
jgi:multidrug resistance protein, MATE family